MSKDYEYKYIKHHTLAHPDYVPTENDPTITTALLEQFKQVVNIGDKYMIPVNHFQILTGTSYSLIEVVTIKAKYPNIVLTSKGCVKYIDLYQGTKIE